MYTCVALLELFMCLIPVLKIELCRLKIIYTAAGGIVQSSTYFVALCKLHQTSNAMLVLHSQLLRKRVKHLVGHLHTTNDC